MEKIQVYVKNVYGNNLIYPKCEKAKIFTKLIKKRTFDSYNLYLIHSLGFQIEITNVAKEKWEHLNEIGWNNMQVSNLEDKD